MYIPNSRRHDFSLSIGLGVYLCTVYILVTHICRNAPDRFQIDLHTKWVSTSVDR